MCIITEHLECRFSWLGLHGCASIYERTQREQTTEKLQNIALVAQGTSEKKKSKEETEDALAAKQMSKFFSREIERRKVKEKLKKHLGSN